MQYKRWEIWLANVKFEDNPNVIKIRPVLVITPQDVFVLAHKMTGTERTKDYEVKNWQKSGLEKKTFIRVNIELQLRERDLLRKIGTLHPGDILGFQKHIDRLKK